MNWINLLIIIVMTLFLCMGITSGSENSSGILNDNLQIAKTHYLEGNLNLSLEIVNEYIVQYPRNTSGWNLKGLILMDSNSYIQAESAFIQALNLSPENALILYNLGLNSFYDGNLYKAEKFLNRSIIKDPGFVDAYFYQGLVQYNLSKYDKASMSFAQATKLKPQDPGFWFNLGMSYEKERKFDDAIRAYDTAIEKDPYYAKPWFFKGMIYNSFGNNALAASSLENFTRFEPNNDLGWFWYAQSLKKINQLDASLMALKNAIRINPDKSEYREFLKAYSGNSSRINIESMFNPLPISITLVFIVILIILSLMAIIRK